jgi:VanZ family protein
MARTRKAVYSRRYRQPSLLNNLLFQASLLNPFHSSEFPMSNSRRNIIIRTVANVTGDRQQINPTPSEDQ